LAGIPCTRRKPTSVPTERSLSNGITFSASVFIEHTEPNQQSYMNISSVSHKIILSTSEVCSNATGIQMTQERDNYMDIFVLRFRFNPI
jgi:hypothetical protein